MNNSLTYLRKIKAKRSLITPFLWITLPLFFLSCKKMDTATENNMLADPNIFFNVSCGASNYNSFGYSSKSNPAINGGAIISSATVMGADGAKFFRIRIVVIDAYDRVIGPFSSNNFLPLGNCNADIEMIRRGEGFVGIYDSVLTSSPYHKNSIWFTDDYLEPVYPIDSSQIHLEITSIEPFGYGGNSVEGNFVCRLIDTLHKLPSPVATGTFRLIVK